MQEAPSHRLRGLLATASGLLGASLAVFSGVAWPYGSRPDMIGAGVVGALFSVLVLRWPRLAGMVLLLVATVEFGLVTGATVPWIFQLAWPFFFVAGALAESARQPDGHRGLVWRVVTEIMAVPVVAFLAVAIAFLVQFSSVCNRSDFC
jgi:hypothetical protein